MAGFGAFFLQDKTRVKDRSPDWPSAVSLYLILDCCFYELYSLEDTFPIFIGFSAAGILYGDLHLLGRTALFHSKIHSLL